MTTYTAKTPRARFTIESPYPISHAVILSGGEVEKLYAWTADMMEAMKVSQRAMREGHSAVNIVRVRPDSEVTETVALTRIELKQVSVRPDIIILPADEPLNILDSGEPIEDEPLELDDIPKRYTCGWNSNPGRGVAAKPQNR